VRWQRIFTTMPAVHLRTDAPLHAQLVELARSEGLSLNSYLTRILRADVGRRQRLASALGLSWRSTDAELAEALGEAVTAPLSAIEQQHLPTDPGAAIAYSAGRAAKRAKASVSKPAQAQRAAVPQAWRDALQSNGRLTVTGATGQPLLRSDAPAAIEALPTEFILFTKGVNESVNGSVLFDARAAKLVVEQATRHGVDFIVDLEHRSLHGLYAAQDTDSDARGWFRPEVRSGALWAVKVTWTEDGAARLRSRRQRYTSPAFYCAEFDDKTQLPRVTSLINCAICSMPATHQIAPLVASARGAK
jgi:hypothetical protein